MWVHVVLTDAWKPANTRGACAQATECGSRPRANDSRALQLLSSGEPGVLGGSDIEGARGTVVRGDGHVHTEVVRPPARRAAGERVARGRAGVQHGTASVVLHEARRPVVRHREFDALAAPADVEGRAAAKPLPVRGKVVASLQKPCVCGSNQSAV